MVLIMHRTLISTAIQGNIIMLELKNVRIITVKDSYPINVSEGDNKLE